MPNSSSEIIKAINYYQQSLDRYFRKNDEHKLRNCLGKLYKMSITVSHLEETGIGRTVNSLRKFGGDVGEAAKSLVAKWKEMVAEYDCSSSPSPVKEKEESSKPKPHKDYKHKDRSSSSHKQGDRYNEQSDSLKNKVNGESSSHNINNKKESKSKSDNRNERKMHESERKSNHDKVSEKRDERNHRDKLKKRKYQSSSESGESVKDSPDSSDSSDSPDSPPPKKHRTHVHRYENSSDEEVKDCSRKNHSKHSSDEETKDRSRKNHSKYSSEEETKDRSHKNHSKHSSEEETKNRSHKSHSKHKRDNENLKDKSKNDRKTHKSKHRHNREHSEEKSKSKEKMFDSSSNSSSKRSKSERAEKNNENSKVKKPKVSMNEEGIGSGSGASFAEALGMLEPTSSKSPNKKKIADIYKPTLSSKLSESLSPISVPNTKLDVDINLSSLLPEITPNYRPLGNVHGDDLNHAKNRMTLDDEALSKIMFSKNQRTKVYSGNKCAWSKVPTLFEICTHVLQDNIDALEYTGGVPYIILKPVLERTTPEQLLVLEYHNPYLVEDTDELWHIHCNKQFRNKRREELESWREMYLRCIDEREVKLKLLTANIKQAQDKSLPVRQTKLAYVDSVAKPPRNVARKQGKTENLKKPLVTPSSRLTLLATAGAAGQIAVPNPGSRAASSGGGGGYGGHSVKPKKAPLMQKTLALLKNRYRR